MIGQCPIGSLGYRGLEGSSRVAAIDCKSLVKRTKMENIGFLMPQSEGEKIGSDLSCKLFCGGLAKGLATVMDF